MLIAATAACYRRLFFVCRLQRFDNSAFTFSLYVVAFLVIPQQRRAPYNIDIHSFSIVIAKGATNMNTVTLNNGVAMPILGLGVFQIDDASRCEQIVRDALRAGYRLIDTAAAYGNEEAVGRAVKRSGIPREDIFITTKVWVQDFGYEQTKRAGAASLEKLDMPYIDFVLLHQQLSDYYGSWRTLQEPINGIGSGLAFGNESPWGWLGGFGVNFQDPQWLYGCSMSSAISSDGGHTFQQFAWGNRLKAKADDGLYYTTTSARHNADNHCIVSHRSGRVFRGSDAGLLVKDKNINNYEWTNINSSMGNQLHYSIKVNEFGDQTMLGNTQDVDAQTYRYGRWGHWRGYEGTEAFINPYAGTCYFSGGGGGGLEGISLSSWYEGYTMADVCTGSWYLIHRQGSNEQSLFRIDDFGRKTVNISANTVDVTGAGVGARDFAITRDGDKPTLFVMNTNHTIMRSTDNGNTFETVMVNSSNGSKVPAKFTNAWIAADPNNSNVIYVGQTGKVLKYDLTTGNSENLSEGLPSISCDDILFHEGTGDLYFFSSSSGIYLRDHTTGQWSLWLKGYNPLAAKRVALNYTTQEMVIGDYGRGVWVADLEHPADRYFKNGFSLKELSNVNGRRTIGIDTKWTIPLYYD